MDRDDKMAAALNACELGYEPDDLSVKVSELLIATADEADELIDHAVPAALRLLRDHMKMDVAFVSEFNSGRRVLRHVDTAPQSAVVAVGDSAALEETWCQRVVDGRLPPFIADVANDAQAARLEEKLPFRIGTFISTPIVLGSGEVYGTLCCFSHSAQEDPDTVHLQRLKYAAQLTANRIQRRRAGDKHGRHGNELNGQ